MLRDGCSETAHRYYYVAKRTRFASAPLRCRRRRPTSGAASPPEVEPATHGDCRHERPSPSRRSPSLTSSSSSSLCSEDAEEDDDDEGPLPSSSSTSDEEVVSHESAAPGRHRAEIVYSRGTAAHGCCSGRLFAEYSSPADKATARFAKGASSPTGDSEPLEDDPVEEAPSERCSCREEQKPPPQTAAESSSPSSSSRTSTWLSRSASGAHQARKPRTRWRASRSTCANRPRNTKHDVRGSCGPKHAYDDVVVLLPVRSSSASCCSPSAPPRGTKSSPSRWSPEEASQKKRPARRPRMPWSRYFRGVPRTAMTPLTRNRSPVVLLFRPCVRCASRSHDCSMKTSTSPATRSETEAYERSCACGTPPAGDNPLGATNPGSSRVARARLNRPLLKRRCGSSDSSSSSSSASDPNEKKASSSSQSQRTQRVTRASSLTAKATVSTSATAASEARSTLLIRMRSAKVSCASSSTAGTVK
mmetsp:Transcript_5893/g.24653  ORF Transcript_5893/g.24653 Transcript_5893/m.24653 type:complete len:475 (+) Transcript_5893:675-2099(+)